VLIKSKQINSGCPAYILPQWERFKELVKKYTAVVPAQSATQSGKIYRVQVGAFSVRANADALLAKLKAAGFDGIITEVTK